MFKVIAGFLGSLFSTSKLQDTAIDGLRKLGGLDEMNGEAKAKYILDYLQATKHQSISRRAIAIGITALYLFICIVWIGAGICGYGFGVDGCSMLAVNVKLFLADNIANPFNIILSFYFVMNIAGKVGKNG